MATHLDDLIVTVGDSMWQLGGLPGGAMLAPRETVLLSDRFQYSTTAVYLHTELALTNRRLYAVRPNTLLGLIPVGTSRSNYPIENIAGVSAGTRFDVLGIVFGIFGILFGLGALAVPGVAALGVILLILGIVVILGAPKQAIEVMNSGGGAIRFPVSFFERRRTVEFANHVSAELAGSTRGLGQPLAPEPREALRHLLDLRSQGLITDDEYAAKRTEILARM